MGGLRTGTTTVAPLIDGADLGLFTAETGGTQVGTCASVGGLCTFSNVAPGARYWVRDLPSEAGAAAGYFTNPTLRTGDNEGTGGTGTTGAGYRFQTPLIVAGTTYTSPTAYNPQFMMNTTTTNTRASGGVWPQSLGNRSFPASCGLDVGIVVDLSNSISTSGGASSEHSQMKSAVAALGSALAGTSSTVSGYSFGTTAMTGSSYRLPATSVSGGAGAVTSWANNLPSQAGATNWDAGLYQAAAGGHDVVILLTDGNPTRYGTGQNQGGDYLNRFREVEEAVFSANAVKAGGARVLALGVGSGVTQSGAAFNLRAVSGPTRYNGSNITTADYFQESSYTTAAAALRELALVGCRSTLTVVKKVLPYGSTNVAQAVDGGGGWTFDPSVAAPVTVTPGVGTTAAATSAVAFDLAFGSQSTPASVTVAESLTEHPGFTYWRTDCRVLPSGATVTASSTGSSFSVSVPRDAAVSCTVYNRAPDPGVDITVNKRWVVNGVEQPLNQMPSGTSSSLTVGLPSGTTPTPWGSTTRVPSGSAVTLTEARGFDAAAMPRCSWAGDPTLITGTGAPVTMGDDLSQSVTPTAATTYTIVNSLTCDTRLTLTKTVAGGGLPATAWTLTGGGLSGAGSVTGSVTPGVAHPLAETSTAAGASEYVQTGAWSCVALNSSGAPVGTAWETSAVTVPLGAWTRCTVTNATAHLTLLKHVVSDSSPALPPSSWTLTADPQTAGLGVRSVVGAASAVGDASTVTVRPGQPYLLAETGPGGYTATLQRWDGTTWVAADSTSVTLAAGTSATYRWVNDDVAPRLTLTKVVEGGTAQPSDWDLVATSAGTPTTFASGETKALAAGAYALTEDGPAGYTWEDLTCTGSTSAQGVSPTQTSLTLARGDVVACTFTNVAVPPLLEVAKTVQDVRQGADLTWTVTYHVDVENVGTVPAAYDLSDTPAFGPAATATSLTWERLGSGTPAVAGTLPTTQLADDVTLAVGETHTYAVVVTASVTGAGSTAPFVCGEETAAFDNTATLTYADETVDASACAEPASPSVAKRALPSVQDPVTGRWTIAYDVVVSYPSTGVAGQPAVVGYVATDAPGALPAGVTLVDGWDASGPTPPTSSAAVDAAFDGAGDQTLASGTIALGETHTYRVTGEVTVAVDADPAGLLCPDGGVTNTAVVSNGVGSDEASACAEIDPVPVTVTKSVVGTPTQDADGVWTVVYDIVVANPDPDVAATYRLVDTLAYGAGTTVLGATWNGSGGPPSPFLEAPPGTWSAVLVPNGLLAPGATATFTVTVRAAVATPAGESAELVCTENGGGFLNTAVATSAGTSTEVEACAEPSTPTVDKTFVSAVQDSATGLWAVTTTLTVTGGESPTFYSLSDVPGYPSGATIVGQSVTGPDGPITWDGVAPIVTDVALAAGEVDVYTVVHTVRVTATPADRECTGEPGSGFFNAAALSTGAGVVDEDEVCEPVAELVLPSVTKDVVSVEQDVDGDWTVVYDLVVVQPDGEANPDDLSAVYDLTDELAYGEGIEVQAADWVGDLDGPTPSGSFDDTDWTATLADDAVIAAGSTHTYTVTVTARVTDDALEEGTWVCSEGPGGFLNTAELATGGTTVDVVACAEPAQPELEKSDAVVTPAADGASTLTYTVTVAHPWEATDGVAPAAWVRLVEEPHDITGAEIVQPWSVVAVGDSPVPADTERPESGDWVLADGPLVAGETWTYQVSVTVRPTVAGLESPLSCDDGGATGVVVVNAATVTAGDLVETDDGCGVVEVPDVGILKTAGLPDGVDVVEAGDVFTYTLAVRNNGTSAVSDAVVTDDVPTARLRVVEVAVPTGWVDESVGNAVRVVAPNLPVGDDVWEILVTVEVLAPPVGEVPVLTVGQPAPVAPVPVAELDNTACVAAAGDVDPTNDCDDVTVPLEEIVAAPYIRCVADAPYLGYSVATTANLSALPIEMRWVPLTGTAPVPAEITRTLASGDTGEIAFPGVTFLPSGESVDWPGWRDMRPDDLNADGTLKAGVIAFAGRVRDTTEPDEPWRALTSLTFSVNPSVSFEVTYPERTADGCSIERDPRVSVTKTASVERTSPGGTFDYTVAVTNTGLGAAMPLVLTDPVPATLAVTGVTTSSTSFPSWKNCDVTGEDARGYGGTLRCELFGPLTRGATAPTVTVGVRVDPRTSATSVVNTATATWTNADDPSDTGTSSGSDTVAIEHAAPPARPGATLPWTGADGVGRSLLAAAGLLLLGAVAVWRRRRTREV
ncbi:DUF11 domain-containing protein [Serinibacter arcticus]|nr:DUF11 domain-containing protein [Serinibacter arcticus]